MQTTGCVTFWARERLLTKTQQLLIQEATETERLSPAQASKLYGLLNFLESGMFGRVGCGGLRAIKYRQYSREHNLSEPLRASFNLILTILATQPKRQYWLTNHHWHRVVAASDAAQDGTRVGSGDYRILCLVRCAVLTTQREAFVAAIPDELFDWFTPGNQKIAQLEMLMIAHALVNRADMFRRRRGYWFIDNVASLMCLIRGRSDSADLEKIAQFIHAALFALEALLFWEYIPSKSTWANPISRLGAHDPWHSSNFFIRFQSCLTLQLLDLPFLAVVKVFQFLYCFG